MKAVGTVREITTDWKSGGRVITVDVGRVPDVELEKIAHLEKADISITQHRVKRSLNANAYFHVLVGKIAQAMRMENSECKNLLLRRYGQYEYVGDKIPTYLIKAVFETEILRREIIHYNIIGREYIDGEEYIRCAIIRGSHTYDTAEMAHLIDGTVEEAKALGIETLPPEEIRRMEKSWNGAN